MADSDMSEASSEPGMIRMELERLREELAAIRELLATRGMHAKSATESGISAVQDSLTRLKDDMKDHSSELARAFNSKVQDRPMTSLALAFGVGMLAAQLLRRS